MRFGSRVDDDGMDDESIHTAHNLCCCGPAIVSFPSIERRAPSLPPSLASPTQRPRVAQGSAVETKTWRDDLEGGGISDLLSGFFNVSCDPGMRCNLRVGESRSPRGPAAGGGYRIDGMGWSGTGSSRCGRPFFSRCMHAGTAPYPACYQVSTLIVWVACSTLRWDRSGQKFVRGWTKATGPRNPTAFCSGRKARQDILCFWMDEIITMSLPVFKLKHDAYL